MGQDSRQRRDDRRRFVSRPLRPAEHGAASREDIEALIDIAARFASAAPRSLGPRIAQLNALGAAATDRELDPAAVITHDVLTLIGIAWESGWQPLDLVHATRRQSTKAAARWIARAILVEGAESPYAERAPQRWTDQLQSLAAEHQIDAVGGADALLPPAGAAQRGQWNEALLALGVVRTLPRSQHLMPPPSRWGQARATPGSTNGSGVRHSATHSKMLTKVRALLAKAESTEFAAEAEAFTAKAQDLMTRHSIDEALVADQAGESVEVQGIRVLIHQPYALEKASLLSVVAEVNRTRAVWNDFASCMTLVGVPTDVDQVEMLFTSALVQATRAMTQAGQSGGPSGTDRSTSFRKAFLSAYAVRIGERLTTSSAEAEASYGSSLVPVFHRQAEVIDGEINRLFPHVTTTSRRTRFDARGWDAGTRAADAAVLPAAAVES